LFARVAGERDPAGAGGFRDGAGAGVVSARSGVGVAGRVVPEFGEHPGTEDRTEAGLARDDLSVRVLAKTPLHLGFEDSGLLDHLGDDGDEGLHGGAVGGAEGVGQPELVAAQGVDDGGRAGVDVALPARATQGGGNARAADRSPLHRSSSSGRIEHVDGALTGMIGHRWRIVEVVDSRGALSVPSALEARIGFSSDGYVFGKDTVNALQGNYELTNGGYRVRNGGTTLLPHQYDHDRERIIAAVDAMFYPVGKPGESPRRLVVQARLEGEQLWLQRDDITLTLKLVGTQPDMLAPPSPTITGTSTP
jgi:hypothetical protein